MNVPISDDDVIKTVTELPRTPSNSGLINVKLQRKLEYNKIEKEQLVDKNDIYEGLKYLQNHHPGYFNIKFTPWEDNLLEIDSDDEAMETDSDEENSEDEQEKESNYLDVTCLQPDNPESDIVFNSSTEPLHLKTQLTSNVEYRVAPGEAKVVTNFMRKKHWLTTGFPRHFCDGKNGMDCFRDKKLTAIQYLNQRIQNFDKRFANDPSFIFVAQYYAERHALERQINISYQKGIKFQILLKCLIKYLLIIDR